MNVATQVAQVSNIKYIDGFIAALN